MRKSASRKPGKGRTTNVVSVPAPTGGWNSRDTLSAMAPNDAVKLVNFFPSTTECILRGGNAAYGTGITGLVETLAVYNAMDGTSEMFAVDENDVWDVSASGAASAQSATVTNGKFQWLNFGDGTNNYLMMFNGSDSPLYYNGSTWTSITGASSPALTGLTTTSIISANEHKGRLYFIEKDSLSFWFLAAGAAGGALTEFDLSSYSAKGGYLMWAASWSFDSGSGPDDTAVFMTSEGEIIVYQGTDPSSANTWSLIGVFTIGKPLGRRSFVKHGGELYIITQSGVYPLSKVLNTQKIEKEIATTSKIERSFTLAASNYGSNFGWEGVTYYLESAMIFNIPITPGGEHEQYVMNLINGSWCKFDSWDAECFVVYNDELYFGGSTVVQKAWSGTDDNGSDIVGVGKTAFNYFGSSAEKRFTLFRPMMQVNGPITFLTGFDIDFSDNEIVGESVYSVTGVALWDTDLWDNAYWTSGLSVINQWVSPLPNVGYSVSGNLKVNTSDLEVHWVSNDYLYEIGGVI